MSLTILIRFRVLIFVATIIAITFTSRPDFTTNVEASEIRSTNKKHFRQGPNKGKLGMFGAPCTQILAQEQREAAMHSVFLLNAF